VNKIREEDGMKLQNYVGGNWIDGQGDGASLINPVTGEVVATASTAGLDMAAALDHARTVGGPALKSMSYAERAALLGAIADTLIAHRDKYFGIAQANSGNTKIDASIDVDGGSGTLKYYSAIGKGLGDAHYLRDGGFERFGKDDTFQATHIRVPMAGVAIHINAFNFPSWGMWEKVACSLLSGVPALVKPATATAQLSYEMIKDVVEANILPDGALSLICGSAGDLLSHVDRRDMVAFTGSAETANMLRGQPKILNNSVRFNAEADSLNSSLLGPDAKPGTPEFDLFVKEVAREMTVKAGQKCTAIRRAFVPQSAYSDVIEALEARLSRTVTGDPRNETVTMGPIVDKTQQQNVLEGLSALSNETTQVTGGGEFLPVDADPDVSAFVQPTLLKCDDPTSAKSVHEVEVFGPVATVMPYADAEQAYALSARGGGSLVASVFTGDDAFAQDAVLGLATSHGRVMVVDEPIAKLQTGHGIVMPMCVHGGPGRAGGGEELGGLRGLRFYHHRLAVQGSKDRIHGLAETASEITV
jgi:3,4-dehydroadipyl-CoA semialdehyde dehydrogenase